MNVHFKNPFSTTQIFVPLLLIVAAITFFPKGNTLNNIYSGRQLASVGSVGSGPNACYVQSDVTTLETNKSILENQLLITDTQLVTLESEIQETVNDYETQTTELEKLKREIISDDVLALRQEGINIAKQQLTEVEQAPQSGGVCSTDGYYDQASCENAGYFSGAFCTGGSGYNDQQSCEDAGYSYGGGCSNSTYYDQTSCINGGGTGYVDTYSYGGYGTGYCSNPSYTDQQSCVNAGNYTSGSCSTPEYNDQQSCENAEYTYGGYCTGGYMYPDQQSCENAGSYPSYCSNVGYTDEISCLSAVCSYTPAYCSDGTSTTYEQCIENGFSWSDAQSTLCGNTWTAGATSYGYQWIPGYSVRQNNTWYTGTFILENNIWYEPSWYSYWNPTYWFTSNTWTEPTFQRYGYQWNPGTWTTHGYTWKPTDNTSVLAGLSENIETLKKEYAKAVEENNITKERVQSVEVILEDLTETLRKQTSQKSDIKIKRLEYGQKMSDAVSQIAYALKNQCPSVETYCSDALDDDADGQMDCNDSDCINESSCQTGGITNNGSIFDTILNIVGINSNDNLSTTNVSVAPDLIPIESSAPSPIVSDLYVTTLGTLKSNITALKQKNDNVIAPAMNQIQIKASASAYDELPLLMEKVQSDIDDAETTIDSSVRDVGLLKIENGFTTSDIEVKDASNVYIEAVSSLLNEYSSYFKTLEKFLVDNLPTPDLYTELNQSISTLKNSGEDFDIAASKLASSITSKNALRQEVVYVATLTPASGSSLSYINPPDKLSIEFNKPIEKYLGGIIIIRSDDSLVGTTILPITPGENSITASFTSLQPGKTYSITTDIQLQFANKGYSLKNTWQVTVEVDPTNTTQPSDNPVSDDDNNDDGAGGSEEEKCEKKKGFWSRLFGGKCKTAPDICCMCLYGDTGYTGRIKTFAKTCQQQFEENKCTVTKSVHTPTTLDESDAEKDFPNQCPVEKYDDVRLLRSIHGFDEGDEQNICLFIPQSLLNGYDVDGGAMPSNITIDTMSCNDFDDMSQAQRYAEELSKYMKIMEYTDVKVTIKANQNSVGIAQNGTAVADSCTKATFVVCSTGVEKKLPPCHPKGSVCYYIPGEENYTEQCSESDGKQSSRTCVPAGAQFENGVAPGIWK